MPGGTVVPTTPHSPTRASAELLEVAQAWVDDDPDHDTRVELGDGDRPGRDRRGRGARGPRRPVRRDAGVRHGGAARRARRRPQPDEPRGGHPGGSRAHGIPQGARRPSRSSSSGTTRGTSPTSSPTTPPQWWSARAAGRRCCRTPCRPPCWPSRSGTSAPTPA